MIGPSSDFSIFFKDYATYVVAAIGAVWTVIVTIIGFVLNKRKKKKEEAIRLEGVFAETSSKILHYWQVEGTCDFAGLSLELASCLQDIEAFAQKYPNDVSLALADYASDKFNQLATMDADSSNFSPLLAQDPKILTMKDLCSDILTHLKKSR